MTTGWTKDIDTRKKYVISREISWYDEDRHHPKTWESCEAVKEKDKLWHIYHYLSDESGPISEMKEIKPAQKTKKDAKYVIEK